MEAEYLLLSFRVGDHVECTMEKEVRRLKKIHLALAIARGQSIDAWAKKNDAARSTAFRWASEPEAESESVQLRAWRAVLADQMTVSVLNTPGIQTRG